MDVDGELLAGEDDETVGGGTDGWRLLGRDVGEGTATTKTCELMIDEDL